MTRRTLLIGLPIALAACGESGEISLDDATETAAVETQTAQDALISNAETTNQPQTKSGKAATPAGQSGPEKAEAATAPDQAARIPAAFRGTWDYVDGTCARESDLRMEISPQQIIFYESLGQVKSIEIKSEVSLDVTLAMEGEGETWERVERLTLSDSGDILTPSAGAGEQAYEPMARKRCKK